MTLSPTLRQQVTLVAWLYLVVAALLAGLELVVVALLVPALIWVAMLMVVFAFATMGWWA